MITKQKEKTIRTLEDQTFYSIAKYLYLIRSEEDNKHARLVSLMELIPKYLSYILLAEYKKSAAIEKEDKVAILEKVSILLQAPSFGDWKEILRLLLIELSEAKNLPLSQSIIEDIWRERRDLANLQKKKKELFEIIKFNKPKYVIRKINSPSVRLFDLIEMLVTYRNTFYGHGDIANSHEYKKHNQVIIDILIGLISHIQIFTSKKMVYIDKVVYHNKHFFHEMYVSTGRHIDFDRHTYESPIVYDPEQVYICDEVEDDVTGEYKLIPQLSLFPFILYDFDWKENNRNLLFLSDLKGDHAGYNGYPNNYFFEPGNPEKLFEAFMRPEENVTEFSQFDEGEVISHKENTLDNQLLEKRNKVLEMISPAENPQIWENFEGVYYAYNPPFQLEKETDLDSLVDKHRIRYENVRLKKTKYLLFLGNVHDEEEMKIFSRRLDNFLTFMGKLYEQIPSILETKIEVYFVKKNLPNITFFTGKKMNNPYGIMYFHNENFLVDDMPKLAFLTRDEELIATLEGNYERDLQNSPSVSYFISDLLKHENPKEKIIKDLSYDISVRKRFNRFEGEVSLLDTLIRRKQESQVEVIHLGIDKSPFHVHYFLRELLFGDELNHTPQLGELRTKVEEYYQPLFSKNEMRYKVMVVEDREDILFNLLLAVEGDLILPVPALQEYLTLSEKLEDEVIRVPLYFNGVKISKPKEFEDLVKEAIAEGKKPTKLILNGAIHSFWTEWDYDGIREFIEICKKYRILMILDGINLDEEDKFRYLIHNNPEGVITIHELSPYLALDGYSISTLFFPKSLNKVYDTVSYLSKEYSSAIPKINEMLAISYFEQNPYLHGQLDKCRQVFEYIKEYLHSELQNLNNIDYYVSKNGDIVYIDVENYRDALERKGIRTSVELIVDMLNHLNVVVIPGIAFGEKMNKLRFGVRILDFKGNKAIDAIEKDEKRTSMEFIELYCPKVIQSFHLIKSYFDKVITFDTSK